MLVQRFGSALNLNVHFHMLFLDGVYQTVGPAAPVFSPVAAPDSSDLQQVVEQIAGRIARALERGGLVELDLENAWLATDTQAGPLDDLLGHSITYRIAVGPRAGQKLFTLQTVPPRPQGLEGEPNGAARAQRDARPP
jgi:putative transposase